MQDPTQLSPIYRELLDIYLMAMGDTMNSETYTTLWLTRLSIHNEPSSYIGGIL